jgi:hypothetical protein
MKELKIVWTWDDLREVNPDLTDKQCGEIFDLMDSKIDVSIGVNWDVLEIFIDQYLGETSC